MGFVFKFENLDVYRLAVEVARWMRAQRWPVGSAHIRDQAVRAADSVVLNIAEGMSRTGRAGENHFRIARGSAGEAFAALDIAGLDGSAEQQSKLRRVARMLERLKPG